LPIIRKIYKNVKESKPRIIARCLAKYFGGPFDGMTVWVDLYSVDDVEDAKHSLKNKTTVEVRGHTGAVLQVKVITGCVAVLYYED
jgi:hypothetical protein